MKPTRLLVLLALTLVAAACDAPDPTSSSPRIDPTWSTGLIGSGYTVLPDSSMQTQPADTTKE